MKIPSSVPLLGHIISVKKVQVKDWKHGDAVVGLWDPMTHAIELRADYSGSKMEQTFFHELTHAVLHLMGHRLAHNEAFVDQFASLMHQALTGARYKTS